MPWTLLEHKALSLDIRYVRFELAQDVVVGRLDDATMNAARLTRRWQKAAGDPARMVAALCEEREARRATAASTSLTLRGWSAVGGRLRVIRRAWPTS
jgi:hypothetical protein